MKIITIIYSIVLWFVFSIGYSNASDYPPDHVEGVVYENTAGKGGKKMTLAGASVYWAGTTTGTTTDEKGNFKLELPQKLPAQLVVSFVGYVSDTLLIAGGSKIAVYLKSSLALNEVTIEGRKESTMISTIQPLNVEQITQKELLKAACCNLSESFETNPSVNVSYTDAITGAKEIQMLGLAGIYSQIMTENIPVNHGLGATYGLSYVPGPWMESIQITKGSGSVANGYESTTGQINIEYLKPPKADPVYVNLYGATSGNVEANLHQRFHLSEKTNSLLLFHGESMQTKWDHQEDQFLDMPLMQNFNLFNRWSVTDGERLEGQFGVKVLTEQRRGGQTFYNWGDKADTSIGYGVQVRTTRVEAFSKTGMVFPSTPWKSAGLILSGSWHDQDSYFGLKTYDGKQTGFYGSFIYMSIIGNTNHKWKAGLDYRYDDYRERFMNLPFDRVEIVPGAYAEYTLNVKEKFGGVLGNRIDYHNTWGFIYTPRLHMKYNFTDEIILRVSGGRSFRTANVFADNIAIMATSRNLIITEKLRPERAWNYGANFTAKFRAFYRPGTFSVDYYITEFSNQIIVDTYSSLTNILFYNLEGSSQAQSFQVSFDYEIFKRFDLRMAYKNDHVVMSYRGIEEQKPLVPEHKALVNVAYTTKNEKWRVDFTTQYHGETKLNNAQVDHSDHLGHGDNQVVNNTSPDYYILLGQITFVPNKKWEFYLGGENLTNYRQETPVMNAMEPFSADFDATNIWGPVMGRKGYLGLRFKVLNSKKP